MPLKVAQTPAFQPSDRAYRKFDGRGLYTEIRPNGSKLWYLKYRFLGSEKRLSLGPFPEVRLREHTGWMEFMFPGERSHLKPMCENAMNTAYRRMDLGKDVVTAHGVRETARTCSTRVGNGIPMRSSGRWLMGTVTRFEGPMPAASIGTSAS